MDIPWGQAFCLPYSSVYIQNKLNSWHVVSAQYTCIKWLMNDYIAQEVYSFNNWEMKQ